MRVFDVFDITNKGIGNPDKVTESEWPIFVVSYLESIADMEGWDHFFTYSMQWYDSLCAALEMIEDSKSLKIIENYVQHFGELGIHFDAKSIDSFLESATDEYIETCRDWREEFSTASEKRWELLAEFYRKRNIKLIT